LQASGGVSCVEDLEKLRKIVDFAIVGKALYEEIIENL
jgi:phosphoribosylformimino-5-aminoimidazole carboxamide ribonucleotide (ProFAR) isomerase